jgi:hypothetical protein
MKNLKQFAAIVVLLIVVVSCCDCPSGNPQNIISETQAQEMEQLYLENQHNFINLGIEANYANGEPDNLGALIQDIDDLQKYLIAVKKEAESQGKNNPAIKLVYGAQLDKNQVPRSAPFFMAIYKTENDSIPDFPDYEKLQFPQAFYDKLDPMGREPND